MPKIWENRQGLVEYALTFVVAVVMVYFILEIVGPAIHNVFQNVDWERFDLLDAKFFIN